jgi:protein required for attachment to host cells
MKHAKIWYVIADGGRARFVERDDGGAFRTVSSLVAAELHKRSHDLGLDRPPRAKESASPARHAIEPRRDLHQASKEQFVKLVAPPRALTELKQSLSNQMAKLVVTDLQKDLTKVPDHDLTEHLPSVR